MYISPIYVPYVFPGLSHILAEWRWAVKKKTAKRALRVFGTEVEANEFSDNHADKTFIEHRAGEATRCEGNYCNVAEFCDQFKGAQL